MKYLLLILLLALSPRGFTASYPVSDSDCDGYPQVKVGTQPGTCLGLVAASSAELNWRKPRRIVQIPDTQQFIVTDMGGWTRGRGKVWLLDAATNPVSATVLLDGLRLPHGLAIGPEGNVYIGETDRIFRFKLVSKQATNIETVVSRLPDFTSHSHPLTHFIFDQDYNLIVNVGAPSDQCQEDKRHVYCASVNDTMDTHAAIRRYPYIKAANLWGIDFEVVASGLRNSMALVSHRSGTLLQAENSIDLPGLHEPFEELNHIQTGRFYGWPYCYDNDKVNRLWPTHGRRICTNPDKHQRPWVLLPPHAAPLDMYYYEGDLFSDLKHTLLISYHGYRQTGHRVVSFKVDEKGLPIRTEQAHYRVDPASDSEDQRFTKKSYPATNNLAQGTEVIRRMNAVPDTRPRGRPLGMTTANDGSIWILDDVNKALLRLAKGESYQAAPDSDDTTNTLLAPVEDQAAAAVLVERCQACHGLPSEAESMKIPRTWLRLEAGKRVIDQRLFHAPLRPMPPGEPLSDEQRATLQRWLANL